MGGVVRKEIEVGHDTCLLGFSGREKVDSAVFDASTLTPGGVNEVQTVTINGGPTGGTWTLTFKGQTTSALAYNASAATVQTALRALGRIGSNGVTVTGNAGGPYTVTFGGRHTNKNVEAMTASGASLTGGTSPSVTVAQTVKGSSEYAGMLVITSGLVLTKTEDGKMVREYTADDNPVAEVQVATISGSPTGGTWTLTFDGETTAGIAHDAAPSAVLAALNGLSNIDPGDVTVTGNAGGPYTISFVGRAGEDVPTMTASGASLTGGTSPSAAVAVSVEGAAGEEIVGIFDGFREFLDNTGLGEKPIPVYNGLCRFDKDKIQNYSDLEDDLLEWGAEHNCTFESQGSR